MKILHVTTNYPTPEYPIFGIFVKEQVESLRTEGVECDVIYCDRKGRGTWMYLTYIPIIWWKVLTNKYDIIHCHHALSALLLCCTLWPLFKKCIVSFQNDPTTEWKINLFSLCNLLFNKIILKNKSAYLACPKCVYLPNGVNQDFFFPMDRNECISKVGLVLNKQYILFMDSNKWGRTQKRKDRFDSALMLLRNEYGFANIEELCLYNTPRDLMPLYINASSLHLISSDFEGSPNSVKECMCCNIPVVSTDVGNVKDMIGDIPGNMVVDEFTPEALAKAMAQILTAKDDNTNRRNLFLSKGYGMKETALSLVRLYESIVKKNRA